MSALVEVLGLAVRAMLVGQALFCGFFGLKGILVWRDTRRAKRADYESWKAHQQTEAAFGRIVRHEPWMRSDVVD